jgi:hypothetical protein
MRTSRKVGFDISPLRTSSQSGAIVLISSSNRLAFSSGSFGQSFLNLAISSGVSVDEVGGGSEAGTERPRVAAGALVVDFAWEEEVEDAAGFGFGAKERVACLRFGLETLDADGVEEEAFFEAEGALLGEEG